MIAHNQKTVRSWGKCLTIFGWIFIVLGVITIVCNVFGFLIIQQMAELKFHDSEGHLVRFHFREGGIFILGVFKVLSGYLMYKQGKMTTNTLKPLMSDYKKAEVGITNGIIMSERKTKNFDVLVHNIKKITIGQIIIIFLSVIYGRDYLI